MALNYICILYEFCAATNAFEAPKWGPNLEEFQRRFDPKLTYGEGPSRLRNLYFAYLVELRALAKVAPYLEEVSIGSLVTFTFVLNLRRRIRPLVM